MSGPSNDNCIKTEARKGSKSSDTLYVSSVSNVVEDRNAGKKFSAKCN